MKTGVITDGISRDFEHALSVMDEFNLEYAELQFLWDKEVGYLESHEVKNTKELLDKFGWNVPLSIFGGAILLSSTKTGPL